MTTLAERLVRDTCALLGTFETNLGTELRLPVLYPNGEFVTVVVDTRGEEAIVHDAGFAAMNLSSQGYMLSAQAVRKIEAYARRIGCSFTDGRVWRRCSVADAAGAAITVATVCHFVADQAQPETRAKSDFARLVQDALTDRFGSRRVVPDFEVVGSTGTSFEFTAAIVSDSDRRATALIEAVPSAKSVNGRFRHLYEVKQNDDYEGINRIAVYDEREDFTQSDLLYLQDVANTVAFADLGERLKTVA